jgi:hypothetical protein
MADTRLEKWVSLQKKTWDVDEGSKASRIAIEHSGGELIQNFTTDLDELGRAIQDCLDMQAQELPAGTSHQFRVVSYDPAGKQLAELPQTVRGLSKDASSANQHALQQSRAHHQDVSTMAFVLDKTTSQLEQTCNRLGDLFDDCTQLAESNAMMRLNNEESQLRRLEFERRMDRNDKLFEALGNIGTLVIPAIIEKLGPKFLGATPGEMLGKVSSALEKLNEPAPPATSEGTALHGERSGTPTEPVDSIVSKLPEPRQGSISRSVEGRGAGNRRLVPGKRGPKSPTTKTTKRK